MSAVEPLPDLLDVAKIVKELGVTKAAAEKMMRSIPTVQIPDLRKVYVRREDLRVLLEKHTYSKTEVPRQ